MCSSDAPRPKLAVATSEELIFGSAPRPVKCGRGLTIGDGRVYPELNFTLPPLTIDAASWKTVLGHYERIGEAFVRRAARLNVPGLVVEFEQLPAMTEHPQWGGEITALLQSYLGKLHEATGIRTALRVTIVDLRDADRPPLLRTGAAWDKTREAFVCAAQAGADILSIESIGGKEVHDEALVYGDLAGMVAALGVLSCRDMAWLWDEITAIATKYNVVPGGDTACGFGNTAMQLAGKGMLPGVLAALSRAATAVRSLVAFEHGAVGPSKDCGYENPIIKAITGCPISMEGKSSSCAHFSPLGNIAGAAADLWSNESVQNVQLLSGSAPEAFLELLAYDCRLFNTAAAEGEAVRLRDWLVASDVPTSAEALMLAPDVVLEMAHAIVEAEGDYARTVATVRVACDAIHRAINEKRVVIPDRERDWLKKLSTTVERLPESPDEALEALVDSYGRLFQREAYGLNGSGI